MGFVTVRWDAKYPGGGSEWLNASCGDGRVRSLPTHIAVTLDTFAPWEIVPDVPIHFGIRNNSGIPGTPAWFAGPYTRLIGKNYPTYGPYWMEVHPSWFGGTGVLNVQLSAAKFGTDHITGSPCNVWFVNPNVPAVPVPGVPLPDAGPAIGAIGGAIGAIGAIGGAIAGEIGRAIGSVPGVVDAVTGIPGPAVSSAYAAAYTAMNQAFDATNQVYRNVLGLPSQIRPPPPESIYGPWVPKLPVVEPPDLTRLVPGYQVMITCQPGWGCLYYPMPTSGSTCTICHPCEKGQIDFCYNKGQCKCATPNIYACAPYCGVF